MLTNVGHIIIEGMMITSDERECVLSLLDGVGIEYEVSPTGHAEMVQDILDLLDEEGDEVGERSSEEEVRRFTGVACYIKQLAIRCRLSGKITEALDLERDIEQLGQDDDGVCRIMEHYEQELRRWRRG